MKDAIRKIMSISPTRFMASATVYHVLNSKTLLTSDRAHGMHGPHPWDKGNQ
jgi:hypothetical protein